MPKQIRRKTRKARRVSKQQPGKTLLDRPMHDRIVAEYQDSRRYTHAAAAGGITTETLKDWRARGAIAIDQMPADLWDEACVLRSARTKTGKRRYAWWNTIERKLGVELDPHACLVRDIEVAGIEFCRTRLAAVREFERGYRKRTVEGKPINGKLAKLPDLRAATWLLEHCAPEIYGAAATRPGGADEPARDPREYAAAVAEFIREVQASIAGPPKDEV